MVTFLSRKKSNRSHRLSAKVVARTSQRSLYSCPACPCTHTKRTVCIDRSLSIRSQSSTFKTGFLSDFTQPFFFHDLSHPLFMASVRYFESDVSVMSHVIHLRSQSASGLPSESSQAQTSSGSAYAQDDRLEGCKVLTRSFAFFWLLFFREDFSE